ncbi:hypothetical protein PVAG01_10562 [Phlyctema vagabunda]|uniref:BRCT domain-containing protein n=1 Tax=Phlyctema vagabunda TaxID=108571 RepID=A0ABR4P2N0_9HELO
MSDPSPPVRITRARAAAKVDPKLSVATAASKAKVTRATATTASAAAKRRTRKDDHNENAEEEDELADTMKEIIEPDAPKTRGRQKKAVVPEPAPKEPAAAPRTRGRPKKETTEAPAPEPTRSTRGRAKKAVGADAAAENEDVAEEPVKRTVRGRAPTLTKPAVPKKTVKFQESGKENIAPTVDAKAKEGLATGLKAKPVRKAASAATTTTTATRATRGRAKAEEKEPKSSPLSPKKITQVATAKDKEHSDDELATTEKTPMPLTKSPMKPPGSLFSAAKKIDFTNTSTMSVRKVSVPQDMSASIMASPARRPPQSPFKDAMKASPQKLVLGDSIMMRSPFKPSFPAPQSVAKNPVPKSSFLQSPARRPQSPMKVSEAGSPNKLNSGVTSDQTPKASAFKISRFGTPKTISRTPRNAPFSSVKTQPSPIPEASTTPDMKFSGRLSSIMPREADPAFGSPEAISEEKEAEETQDQSFPDNEPMALELAEAIITAGLKPTVSTENNEAEQNPAFHLREQDESPFDSDSEDELASVSPRYSPEQLTEFNVSAHDFGTSPITPTPFTADNKTSKTSHSSRRAARRSEVGFTPLAKQLSTWMAASPESDSSNGSDREHPSPLRSNPIDFASPSIAQGSPAKSTFFEDEMLVRDDILAADDIPEMLEQDPNFTPVDLIEEDLELAAEADEMSVLEHNEMQSNDEEEVIGLSEHDATNGQTDDLIKEFIQTPTDEQPLEYFEETLADDVLSDNANEDAGVAPSEASQEYGDENAIPIDPTLLDMSRSQPSTFATPKRVMTERVFHTVSKVPLKAAAEDSPMKGTSKKRSASISRLPVSRPSSNLSRNNTVISYSPTKSAARKSHQFEDDDTQMSNAPVTPSKSVVVDWSTAGTPARTPRPDLNTSLLKGAVVFVDVHTSEGADASMLFTELLTEMGARCVKTWTWTPTSEDGSKIGITHVVFKDGGKRTLEKAKATNGVVACVGVGWVLDCERENRWLDEASYAVDTAEVPRGGHRRRKSMEPRALANYNGTLMTPSAKTPNRTKDSFGFLETPGTSKSYRRRESVQWMRSPASSNSSEDHVDDQTMALSPIPTTPGPDTISAYGEAYLDQLNAGAQTPGGAETPYFLHKENLVQKTAPPKQRYDVDGNGVLSEKKDESVMMRLMAARRKSLQWAPKVGSPLARSSQLK